MTRITLLSALFIASAGAAAACPDFTQSAVASYSTTGSDLFMPEIYAVRAGGQYSLQNCGLIDGTGYFIEQPDFSFNLSEMASYRLEVSVVSDCDSALLINTSSGQWMYDDDGNGNLDPKIAIARPGDGRIDVWIGTYDGEFCDAELKMETFLR